MTLPRHANLSYYTKHAGGLKSVLPAKQSGLEPRDGIKMNRSQWVEMGGIESEWLNLLYLEQISAIQGDLARYECALFYF